MNDVKLLNRVLWGVNILLGAGIVVFSFQYLLFAPDAKYLKDFKQEDDSPRRAAGRQDNGDGALRTLVNPVEKRQVEATTKTARPTSRPPSRGRCRARRTPSAGVAFIKSTTRNAELVAYVGDEILHEGQALRRVPRLDADVGHRRTGRSSRARAARRRNCTIDQATPVPAPAAGARAPRSGRPAGRREDRPGLPRAEGYKSRLLASADSRQVWGMDQDEIEWASQNAEQIMDRDFQVAPYAGGGLRIENVNAGTIGAARGLMAGDVLREVNGQPLNNIADVRQLMSSQAMKKQTGLRLTIERAGKPVVIEYRPLPK